MTLPIDSFLRPKIDWARWVGRTEPPSAASRRDLTPSEKQALAEKFAPILYFHPNETNFLQDPNTFIAESSLRQERDFRPDNEIYGEGEVPAHELAGIGPENADADSQKFLDHSNDARAGDLQNSKLLYSYDADSNSVTYYHFYSYNEGPPGSVGHLQNHEGDWERVTVQLNANFQPVEVRYAAHDGMDISRPWANAPTEEGRPVVYVGQGSHASYPEPGRWTTSGITGSLIHDRASDRGLRWDTSTQPAVDVTTQPWYGSHVLWGERGAAQEVGQGLTSGPTGPSPEKGEVSQDADPNREPLPWWLRSPY